MLLLFTYHSYPVLGKIQVLKFLKGYVELDFNFIVPAHIDSLDKLRQNHLFSFKCTVVVHIGPADQLGVLLLHSVRTVQPLL